MLFMSLFDIRAASHFRNLQKQLKLLLKTQLFKK